MPDAGRRAIVIGIGNPDRGDDGAGPAVVRWLRGKLPADIEIRAHDGEPASLLACLEGARAAWLIDASASGAAAGSVLRFDARAAPLPEQAFAVSTHGLGVAQALELARALGELPGCCIVYAIEGGTFEPGAPLSPAVAAAVAEVGERLRRELCGAADTGARIDA